MSSQSPLTKNPAAPPVATPSAADLMQKAVPQVEDQVANPLIMVGDREVRAQGTEEMKVQGTEEMKVRGTEAETNLQIMEEDLVTRLQGTGVENRKARDHGTVVAEEEEEVSNPRMVVVEGEAVGSHLL